MNFTTSLDLKVFSFCTKFGIFQVICFSSGVGEQLHVAHTRSADFSNFSSIANVWKESKGQSVVVGALLKCYFSPSFIGCLVLFFFLLLKAFVRK